jgi:hypothetical protein
MDRSHVLTVSSFTLDPPHWTLKSCFGAFQTVSSRHENRCKTGRTGAMSAQARATKPRRSFSERTHPIHPIEP